jgi:hypothetical protein
MVYEACGRSGLEYKTLDVFLLIHIINRALMSVCVNVKRYGLSISQKIPFTGLSVTQKYQKMVDRCYVTIICAMTCRPLWGGAAPPTPPSLLFRFW